MEERVLNMVFNVEGYEKLKEENIDLLNGIEDRDEQIEYADDMVGKLYAKYKELEEKNDELITENRQLKNEYTNMEQLLNSSKSAQEHIKWKKEYKKVERLLNNLTEEYNRIRPQYERFVKKTILHWNNDDGFDEGKTFGSEWGSIFMLKGNAVDWDTKQVREYFEKLEKPLMIK